MGKNNGKKNNSCGNSIQKDEIYCGAPYNFVSLPEKINVKYNTEEELPCHNKIYNDRYSGEISYTIKANSPIFISDGNGKKSDFYKNLNGNYAIPGSSVRGLIRGNLQVLGVCSVGMDIDENTLMYRTMAASKDSAGELKDRYGKVLGVIQIEPKCSLPSNVKAGYIKCIGGKYYLYKTKVDKIDTNKYNEMNYYHTTESLIREKLSFKEVHSNNPFVKKIRYGNIRGKNVNEVQDYKSKGSCLENGYLVRSGYMRNKKVVYVIPEIDNNQREEISERDILAFKHDYEQKKNPLRGNQDFYALPENGQKCGIDKVDEYKPVFYIRYNGRLYFGFTPYLRLFYEYSIKDGLPLCHKDNTVLDYAKSMFGYSDDDRSYRSRVYFEDAEVKGNCNHYENRDNYEDKTFKVILGSPKPSSYRDYIVQPSVAGVHTYNTDNFRIRGIKHYWFRHKLSINTSSNAEINSTIKPLNMGTKFQGRVRFESLSEDELGLLLWSIRLEDKCFQNIGMGKPYGFGKIEVKIDRLSIYNYNCMYNLDNLCLNPFEDKTESINQFIDSYKQLLKKIFSVENVQNIRSINELIIMKTKVPEDKKTRYMSINDKEYANRTKSLQTPEQV